MAKVLCRFRWHTSAPIVAGTGQPDLRVHIGAVHVHLPAVLVDDVADGADAVLEDAVRRGIGDHQRREPIAVLGRLLSQVVDVHIASGGRRHDNHTHAGHRGACRIRSMGGRGNEHDVAAALSRWPLIRADRHQSGQLALRP
jgi:hypothetical protein